jgi:recombination protein RecT
VTTQTISNAVAKRDTGPEAQLKAYKSDFATVLPSHLRADTWVRVAQGILRRDAKLRAVAERNVGSFLAALLDCARLGLEPGETYHLVPFGNEVVGIEDYKGLIELMYRAGAVASVKAEVVYAGDFFDYEPGSMPRPVHKPAGAANGRTNWFAPKEERGKMVGAYAYAEMKDGSTSRVVVMAEWEINEHKAVSKTSKSADSMWVKWPRSAWLKTVTKELTKWVPTSPEWITHKVRAERAGEIGNGDLSPAALALPGPTRDVDFVDGEVVEPPQPPAPEATTEPAVEPPVAGITERQSKRLHAILTEGQINRDTKLALLNHLTNRDEEITTSAELTEAEADLVINKLAELARFKIPLIEAVVELIDRPADNESSQS